MQERPEPAWAEKGPRFAVRFDPRGGELSLSHPLVVSAGVVIEALVAGVGRPRAPVVLAGGAARLRHRRSEVRQVRVAIELRAIEQLALARDLPLRVVRAEGPRLVVGLLDAWGPLAVEVLVTTEGAELGLAVVDVRAPTEGPSPAWSRALARLAHAGLPLEESTGLVRVADPLGEVLRHALAPHGWRVPRTGRARLDVEARGGKLVLVAPGRGDGGVAARAEARVLAPVLRALALHDAERARAALAELSLASPWAMRLGAALAVDVGDPGAVSAVARVASLPGGSPLAAVLSLRLALAAGDPMAALAAARRADEAEPVDEVAVASLSRAASLDALGAGAALDLAMRAAQRAGAGADVVAKAATAAARAGDAVSLASLLGRAASLDRAAAVQALVSAARVAEAPDVVAVVAHAAELAPDDGHVLAAQARTSTGDAAASLHERAARALEDAGDATAASRELVRAAVHDEGHAAAWLARAVTLDPRPAAIVALARAEERRGAYDRAADVLAPLVALAPEPGLADALADAAALHAAHHDAHRARSFTDALARVDPSHAALSDLRAKVGAELADAVALSPERLARLDPFLLSEVARASTSPAAAADALLAAFDVAGADATSLLAAAQLVIARLEDGPPRARRRARLASLAATHAERIVDAEALGALAPDAESEEQRARLHERVATLHRTAGQGGLAARALAQAAVVRRDPAGLRAALDLAERAGATEDALAIVRSALEVTTDAPERESLLRRAEALERAKG